MAQNQLKQEEIEYLLSVLKTTLVDSVKFPTKGKSEQFEVKSTINNELFSIRIYRGNVNRTKYNLGAIIERNSIPLLELHIGSRNRHVNPDGVVIEGSHWHIYSEEHGRTQAFPAENIDSEEFVENTIVFLDKFNVIVKPEITVQLELV